MSDPAKKAAVFLAMEAYGIELACLQETHLTNDTKSNARNYKFQEQYHSVYTSYSRGVSILVGRSISFSCREARIDALGRYVFLSCVVENRPLVLANIYVPPPFNTEPILDLLEFVDNKADVPIILVGDFNTVLDNTMDRFPPLKRAERLSEGRLGQLLREVGWCDLWRSHNPNIRQYSCYSGTHSTLSRLDMALGNCEALQLVGNIEYKPRGISDHSPMTLTLNLNTRISRKRWTIKPLWLDLISCPEEVTSKLKEFVTFNAGTAPAGVV